MAQPIVLVTFSCESGETEKLALSAAVGSRSGSSDDSSAHAYPIPMPISRTETSASHEEGIRQSRRSRMSLARMR